MGFTKIQSTYNFLKTYCRTPSLTQVGDGGNLFPKEMDPEALYSDT